MNFLNKCENPVYSLHVLEKRISICNCDSYTMEHLLYGVVYPYLDLTGSISMVDSFKYELPA